MTVLQLGFLYAKCGVYFEMNDDRMINEILAGVLTGSPDGHGIFVNYLLGGPLAFLYQCFPQIPWFGMLLIGSHGVIYWCFFGILLERSRNWYQHLLALLCGTFLVFANLYIFGEIQYTSTAILLAAEGYFCLLWDKRRVRRYVLFGVLELLALLLRSQSMLMIQLIGGLVWATTLLTKWLWKQQLLREIVKEAALVGGMLVCMLVLSAAGNRFLGEYGSPKWQEYTRFRELRGDMADYYGFPSYEKAADILERYQVSETEYLAFTRYWMLGNVLETECLQELHEMAEADYRATRSSAGELLKGLVTSRFQGGIMGYGKYTLMLYAFVGALLLVCRRWQELFPFVALNLGRNAVLGYLLYGGRLPFRVLSGLYFIEVLFLTAWLWCLLSEIYKKKLWIPICAAGIALAMTVISVESFQQVYRGLYWKHYGRESMSLGMDDLIAYCTGEDAGYICVEMATTYYTGEALSMDWYRDRNYISSGFWWSESPHITAYQQAYLEKHRGNLRLIEMGEGMDPNPGYAVKLFTEDWGLTLELREELTLRNGIVLTVYDIIGELPMENAGAS